MVANANPQEYLHAEDLVPFPSDVSVFPFSKYDSVSSQKNRTSVKTGYLFGKISLECESYLK